MRTIAYKSIALLMSALFIILLLPRFTGAETDDVKQRISISDELWNVIEEHERSLDFNNKKMLLSDMYEFISTLNIKNPEWDDDDTFSFENSAGVRCIYDYDTRKTERNLTGQGDNSIKVYGNSKGSGETDVFLVGPYYGYDSSFTDYYRNLAQTIANTLGGTATVLSGTSATPGAIKARLAQKRDRVCLFDSHGISMNGTSYLQIRSSDGITNEDFNNRWAASLTSGVYGIDANCMTQGQTTQLSNCFMWFATCEGMMKSGLSVPFVNCGAGGVYGYSKSVSFTGDYAYAKQFWNKMLDGYNVAESIAYMKQICGQADNAGIGAYPIVVSPQDSYPSNVNSPQTVHCSWTLFSNNIYFITYNANGGKNEPPVQKIELNEGEDTVTVNLSSQAPYKFPYTFDGWGTENNGVSCYQPGQEITISENTTLYAAWFISDKLNIGADNQLKVRYPDTYEYRKVIVEADKKISFDVSSENVSVSLLSSSGEELASGKSFEYEMKTGTNYYIAFTSHEVQDFVITVSGDGIERYTLSYSADGAENVPAAQSGSSSFNITKEIPSRFPYNFIGWSYQKDAEKADFMPGQSITLTQNTMLYAVWSQPETIDDNTTAYSVKNFFGADRYVMYKPLTDGKAAFSANTEMTFYSTDKTVLGQGRTLNIDASANTIYYICVKADIDVLITLSVERPIAVGDVNGDGKINTSDATLILKFSAGMYAIGEKAQKAADVNDNGFVNTADAVLILKYAVGMITEF